MKKVLYILALLILLAGCGKREMDEKSKLLQRDIFRAVESGNTDKIRELIKKGADVDATDYLKNTPLFFAAEQNKKEIVEILISAGACVDFRNDLGETPLWSAVCRESWDAAKVIIANGADVNAKVPFSFSKLNGVDVNEEDTSSWSLLYYSVFIGNKEIAEVLIENDADVNAQDSNGKTPLDRARSEKMKELLRYHGAVSWKELKEKEEE